MSTLVAHCQPFIHLQGSASVLTAQPFVYTILPVHATPHQDPLSYVPGCLTWFSGADSPSSWRVFNPSLTSCMVSRTSNIGILRLVASSASQRHLCSRLAGCKENRPFGRVGCDEMGILSESKGEFTILQKYKLAHYPL